MIVCTMPNCQTSAGCKCSELAWGNGKSYFHLANGYPHNTEARQKIKELIEWYHGGAACTPGQVEAVLGVLASRRVA